MAAAGEVRVRPATRSGRNSHSEIEPLPDELAKAAISVPHTRLLPAQRNAAQVHEVRMLLRLTCLMTGLWLFAVSLGMIMNTGLPPERGKLPLITFDRLMRTFGTLLPLPVMALRWYATLPPSSLMAAVAMRHPSAAPAFLPLLALYGAVSTARIGLYALHVALAPFILQLRSSGVATADSHHAAAAAAELHVAAAAGVAGDVVDAIAVGHAGQHSHLISDHIFLGASLVAILTAEAHLLAAFVRRRLAAGSTSGGQQRRLQLLDRAALCAAAAICAALFVLTCGEMHITARHFHAPGESFWAVVLGLLFFQLPVSMFLWRMSPRFIVAIPAAAADELEAKG